MAGKEHIPDESIQVQFWEIRLNYSHRRKVNGCWGRRGVGRKGVTEATGHLWGPWARSLSALAAEVCENRDSRPAERTSQHSLDGAWWNWSPARVMAPPREWGRGAQTTGRGQVLLLWESFIGTQTRLPVPVSTQQLLVEASAELRRCGRHHVALKPQVFTVWPFTENICWSLLETDTGSCVPGHTQRSPRKRPARQRKAGEPKVPTSEGTDY